MHNTQYNNSNNIIPIMNNPNSDIWIRRIKLDLNPGLENLDLTDIDTWTDLDKLK